MNQEEPSAADASLFTLHRYFIWTNRLREHLLATLEQQGPMPDTTPDMSNEQREAVEQAARTWLLPVFFYGSYWLASLYVLVEGWQRLRLTDPAVDELLDTRFVELLRTHRNGVFHYHPKYLNKHVQEFMSGTRENSQAVRLHDAFGRFFLNWFQNRGEMPYQRPPGL